LAALDRLTGADLLVCEGTPPNATFLFKHALIQDIAYSTLLRGPRRDLHRRIAEVLTDDFPDLLETLPEMLAHHYSEAGLIEQAVSFWAKAGQRSISRSALVEAVTHLTKALNQLATLPTTPTLRREQIELQLALAGTLLHVKGYGSPHTLAAFEHAHVFIEHAEKLGERSEDPLLRFSVRSVDRAPYSCSSKRNVRQG
jgi:hypothetical protein